MIQLDSRPQPNFASLNSPEVQACLPGVQKDLQRALSIIEMFPSMAASYMPNHSTVQAPPAHYAAIKGSVHQLKELVDRLDDQTVKGLTPLHYAIIFRQKEAARFLIEKCDLGRVTSDGNSYLHYAALTGDPEIVELFLNRSIDPSIRNKDSLSAAHLWAFRSDDLTYLKKLSPPEDPSAPEPYYFTPLQLLALNAVLADQAALSESEIELFIAHISDLAVVSLSQLCQSYKIRNIATSFLEMMHSGLQMQKADPIHKLAPSKLQQMTNPGMVKSLHLNQWMPLSIYHMPPWAMAVQSSISASAVAWNTVTKLPQLMQLSWKNGLAAAVVRLTNLALSGRDVLLALNYPRYEGEECYLDALLSTQNMDLEKLKHLPDMVEECQTKFPKLRGNLIVPQGHSEARKAYRSAALKLHPDKQKESDLAIMNLNKLYEAIPRS